MLPNVDPTKAASSAAVTPSTTKKPDVERAVPYTPTAPKPAAEAEKAGQTATEQRVAQSAPSKAGTEIIQRLQRVDSKPAAPGQLTTHDQAEINFQLTREERDVFLNAISGDESVEEMTKQEQETLQKTAERIEKLIEDADTRTAEGRERLDKAIKEWYTRLANGKHKPPTDLIRLIQAAAAGRTDLTYI